GCRIVLRRFLIPRGRLAGAAARAWSSRDATPAGVRGPTSVLLAGRHAQRPAGHDPDDDGDEIEDGDSLVSCRPLPYDSVTRTIGPEGGELEVGRNWLVIPQGALRDPVSITAVAPSDTVAMVRFRPEGLRFLSTALLVLTYDNC